MNQEIKKKWTEALRSGNYQQGRNVLNRNGKFCCLGVLCDLHSKETSNQWEDRLLQTDLLPTMMYLDNACYLPDKVVNWAGLQQLMGNSMIVDNQLRDLDDLNDQGYSFEQIADLIEAQL